MNPFLLVAIGAMVGYIIFGQDSKESSHDEALSQNRVGGGGRNGHRQPSSAIEANRRRVSDLFADPESAKKEAEQTSPQKDSAEPSK